MENLKSLMGKRNAIECVSHSNLSKKEIIKLIDMMFPDEEVGSHGQVVQITTTKMSDGTQMQSVCFGKMLDTDKLYYE